MKGNASLYKINSLPDFEMVQAPRLTRQEKKSLQKAEEMIARTPYFFNGEILHVKETNKTSLSVFPATFAWSLAEGLPTLGALGISLMLRNNEKHLWQKRGKSVLLPGLWDFAAGGHATSSDLQEEIGKEAAEEIGQEYLPGLAPAYLLIGEEGRTDIVFSALWSGDAIIINDEIESFLWQKRPPERSTKTVQSIAAYLEA